MASYVYIPIAGENKISIFILNPDTGQLTFQRDVAVDGAPGPLAVDPKSKFPLRRAPFYTGSHKFQYQPKHR